MDIESILKSMEDYIKDIREMVEKNHPNCRCGGEAYTKELEMGGWYIGCKDCNISTTIKDTEAEAWATWDKVMK